MAIDIRSWVSPKRMAETASAGAKSPAAAISTEKLRVIVPGPQARLAAPGKAAIVAGNLQAPSPDRPIASRHPKLADIVTLASSQSGHTAQAKAIPPEEIAKQAKLAKKILDWHMGKSKDGMREKSPPAAMLAAVNRMALHMMGKEDKEGKKAKLTEAQIAAFKEVVKKSVAPWDPDMARRCNEAIDAANWTKFEATEVNDASRLHPSGFSARANLVAGRIQGKEGQMSIGAIRKMFDDLDDIHVAVKASVDDAGKQARMEVESCIRASARSLHDAYKTGRNSEDVTRLRVIIKGAITDDVLNRDCQKYFETHPTTKPIERR